MNYQELQTVREEAMRLHDVAANFEAQSILSNAELTHLEALEKDAEAAWNAYCVAHAQWRDQGCPGMPQTDIGFAICPPV